MAKKAPQPESAHREPNDIDRLERTVKELAGQVRSLTLLMDEIRDELIYAVRNDRFNAIPDATWKSAEPAPRAIAAATVPPKRPAAEPATELASPSPAPPRGRPNTLFG